VIALPASIWQAGEPLGACPDGGAGHKLELSADAGGTSQAPPPRNVIGVGDRQHLRRRRSWKLSRRSPVTMVRALSAMN
jgi:hypothetical protein